jgi:iron(III) transport system ATP-binding protein
MIEVRHLTRRFGVVTGAADVTFVVNDGERVALLGPSGSGKTTMLRLIAGLERPDAGEVLVDGAVVSGPGVMIPPHQRHIGFVFQAPALWPHMTVAEHVRFGLNGMAKAAARQRVREVLEQASLAGLERRYPAELSGGQARLVALARTLAPRPRHLLLDEPLANLDSALKERLLGLIDEAARRERCSLLYVTHDGGEAARLATRALRITDGRLVSDGRPKEECDEM